MQSIVDVPSISTRFRDVLSSINPDNQSGAPSAQMALQSGNNLTPAAAMTGVGSDMQLRRAWHPFAIGGVPSSPIRPQRICNKR
jgi:hypothetical protein